MTMASRIEQQLYGTLGTHALLSLTPGEGRVAITVAPWTQLTKATSAFFRSAELTSLWIAPDCSAEELAFPWDIIGFDCYERGQDRWDFVLYCSHIELCWRSRWPDITCPHNKASLPQLDEAQE